MHSWPLEAAPNLPPTRRLVDRLAAAIICAVPTPRPKVYALQCVESVMQ